MRPEFSFIIKEGVQIQGFGSRSGLHRASIQLLAKIMKTP